MRSLPSDEAIRNTPDRLVPTILIATRPVDWTRWVTTLWNLVNDSPRSDEQRQMIAAAQHRMMHDPMGAALMRARLRARLSPQRITTERMWDPLLAPCIWEPHPRQRGARGLAPRAATGASHPVGG